MVYEPAEDSYLLEKQVKRFAKGNVLDMGTGSGIQAVAAAEKKSVKKVLAVDVQKDVMKELREKLKKQCKDKKANKKIKIIQSDLFQKIPKQKFDTIIFNPPYLPQQLKERDVETEAGKKGYAVVEKFLDEVNEYLKEDGQILLLFSSLTDQKMVDRIMARNLLQFQQLAKKHIFFEDLLVYKIKKSRLLQRLNKKATNLEFFAKGHRGMLFTARYKGKKAAVKTKLPESQALGRIQIESHWLKRLNKKKIGPRLLYSEKDFFIMEFVDGKRIFDYAEHANKKQIKSVLAKVFEQCYQLDKININKEEMHRPYKHIIIKNNKPSMIDFERANYSRKPKNVTQMFQFINSGRFRNLLIKKGLKINKKNIIKMSKIYKKTLDKKIIEKILKGL
jgi:HemK-related putative methylase